MTEHAPEQTGGTPAVAPELLATPEELAARKAKAAAEAQASLSPKEALLAAHDRLSDDEIAGHIAANPGTVAAVMLELWRRITGD